MNRRSIAPNDELDPTGYILEGTLPDVKDGATNREFIATTVLRRQVDGTWKALIDNPIGPLVLGA